MTTTPTHSATGRRRYNSGAVGLSVFAAAMMFIGGTVQAVQGIVALVSDAFYAIGGEEYLFRFDTTSWGWIHLTLGIVVAVAGFALLMARTWARVGAVVVAAVNVVANFAWMPYYPLWSLTVIALNIAVIWAVTLHGRDVLGE